MKNVLISLIIIFMFQILNALPQPLADIQKQVAIQAGELKNSPSHQLIRMNQDTRSYVVGDTHTFWRWNLAVMPPTWIQTPATCRAVGAHCYVFVADSEWNVHMTQANVDTIMVRLEERTVNDPTMGAIQMVTNEFGPIPNELDNDPKLIVFYSALGSFNGTSFDGYFSAYNQVTEAQAQQMNPPGHSNLCEMIYMTCYPLSPVASVRLSVLAHELTHMVEWGLDSNEETWIDEGCAELAMVKYGVPDPISGFNSNPDNSLTAWNQTTADYVKVMLFFTYLSEHYDTNGLIRDIVADPVNGLTSISNQIESHTTEMTLSDVFRDWTIANHLDDPLPDLGLYNYEQLSLPAFFNTFNYTQEFVNVIDVTGTVQPWATDYINLEQNQWEHHGFFTGNHNFHLSVIAFPGSVEDEIGVNANVEGDNFEWFNYFWNGRYVFAIANPSDVVLNYTFSISTGDAVDDNVISPPLTSSLECYPNPFIAGLGSLTLSVKNSTGNIHEGTASIFNIKGQLVKKVILQSSSDKQTLSSGWDGRNGDGELAASGVYFVRYCDGLKTLNKKIIILR